MSNIEKAMDCFINGFSCSQSICMTYGEQYGMDNDTAAKVACGFGGGMGRIGGPCGALTGALMVLGLRDGSSEPGTGEAKLKTYELVREAARRFEARNGSMNCRDLLGFNIENADEYKKAADAGVFRSICPNLVKSASEILEELL